MYVVLWRLRVGHADCKKKRDNFACSPTKSFTLFCMDDVARVAIQHLEYSTFMYFLNTYKTMNYGYSTEIDTKSPD